MTSVTIYKVSDLVQSIFFSDLHYKKKGEKDRDSNNFNACDTAQYKEQKQKKKSDLEYSKDGLDLLDDHHDHFFRLFDSSIQDHIFKRRDFATKMREDAGKDFFN